MFRIFKRMQYSSVTILIIVSGSSTFDSRAETGALASSAAVVLNQPVQQQPVPGKQCKSANNDKLEMRKKVS